jgi:hypothetical protein
MAKLVFGMNQSLDGYVDDMAFAPGPTLFRHFINALIGPNQTIKVGQFRVSKSAQ